MTLRMSQGLAYGLVFEQDGKFFWPMVVEDISTHLEKVNRLAWLGEPKSLSLPIFIPALIDRPIGKTLLQVFTNCIEASSIDLRHIRPPKKQPSVPPSINVFFPCGESSRLLRNSVR